MKKKTHPASVSHDVRIVAELRSNPGFAKELLRASLAEAGEQDGDYVLQKTLRLLTEARGVAKVAKSAGIPRESLSRALSEKGNPRLSTLQAVTAALGLRLTVASATARY